MALYDKADFIGTHVIDTAAKRDFILARSNNRGHQHFESMAIAAGATNQPPLSLADMLQTYVLDTAEKVEQVLQNSPTGASALRGHEFLTAVKFAGDITPAGVLSTGNAGTPADPFTLTLTGWFTAGLTLDIGWQTDLPSGPGTAPWVVPYDMGPLEVAQLFGDYLKGPDGLTTTVEGNVITFLPYAPATVATMSAFSIV